MNAVAMRIEPDELPEVSRPYVVRRFHTLDVFTDRIHGGNPLAVFPDGGGLTTQQMQRVARELNLSETVFVLPPESPRHTKRLRIFTPAAEIPFAGHPTVGTAHLLAESGEIRLDEGATKIVFEEGVGPVPVSVDVRDGRPVFARLSVAKLPEFGPPPPPDYALADLLSLDETEIGSGSWRPAGLSTGLPFLFVPVRDRAAVRRARIDLARWEAILAGWWAQDVFVFSRDPELPGSHIRARMFAPGYGIPEDPATGSAVAALAGYLAMHDGRRMGRLQWVVEQGFEMGRPSLLHLEADVDDGATVGVRVGGSSVLVSEGTMRIPID